MGFIFRFFMIVSLFFLFISCKTSSKINVYGEWKGGVETLDGQTKSLFGDEEIPYIWLGEIESTIAIEIIK
jgi:hypothetical protein